MSECVCAKCSEILLPKNFLKRLLLLIQGFAITGDISFLNKTSNLDTRSQTWSKKKTHELSKPITGLIVSTIFVPFLCSNQYFAEPSCPLLEHTITLLRVVTFWSYLCFEVWWSCFSLSAVTYSFCSFSICFKFRIKC